MSFNESIDIFLYLLLLLENQASAEIVFHSMVKKNVLNPFVLPQTTFRNNTERKKKKEKIQKTNITKQVYFAVTMGRCHLSFVMNG